MKKVKVIFILASIIYFFGCKQKEFETWRFIDAPDLHNVELFAEIWEDAWTDDFDSYEAYRKHHLEIKLKKFKRIQETYGAELFVSPGDCNNGRWDAWGWSKNVAYRTKFLSIPEYANLNKQEVILKASQYCYSALNELVFGSGYKEFFMAVGDHELGDNPWPKGGERPETLPAFRQGFANSYTLKEPNGESRFNKPIGNAPARPIGTIYENTSYAAQYKNVLFISVDVFRFEGKDKVLGEQGLVSGDIAGKHLEWLENVLKEAQDISSIKHIVVQSHLPIIYPVRKYQSSGLMMHNTRENVLLKTMRNYNVDLYLAGEVHMNTLTKDPESDLIQFVGRGNGLSNFTIVEVEPQKLTINCFRNDDTELGKLCIDKSTPQTTIKSEGILTPIKPKGLQINWGFDEKTKVNDFSSSLGNFSSFQKYYLCNPSEKTFVYPNEGDFGINYSLFGDNVELTDGVCGKAAKLSERSKLFAVAIGPMDADFKRTVSCWIKTERKGRRSILNLGLRWHREGEFFNLSLNEGNLELSLRPEKVATAKEKPVNDGEWHHVAIVVPKRNASLSDCKLYVDGEVVSKISYENGDAKINTDQANWMTLATQSDKFHNKLAEKMGMKEYTGLLDDFSIWTRALSDEDIKTLYTMGKQGINAIDVEKEL